jgi:(p)ppGpp synthase/HD superfamily hydrolase
VTPAVFEAAMFATYHHDKPHRGKARRGGRGVPYVHHCFDVAGRLTTAGLTEESAIIAAILHDVVEDTYATLEEVHTLFGPVVATYVNQLTLPVEIHQIVEKKVQHQKLMMLMMDWNCRAIKIADKTSNVFDLVQDPPGWGLKAIQGYANDAKAVVDVVRLMPFPPEFIVKLIDRFEQSYASVVAKKG